MTGIEELPAFEPTLAFINSRLAPMKLQVRQYSRDRYVLEVINPKTRESIGYLRSGSKEEVGQALNVIAGLSLFLTE